MKYIAAAVFLFALIAGTLSLHEAALDSTVTLGRFSILVGVYGLLFCGSGLILDLDILERRRRIEVAEQTLLKDVAHIRDQAAQADQLVRTLRNRERSIV